MTTMPASSTRRASRRSTSTVAGSAQWASSRTATAGARARSAPSTTGRRRARPPHTTPMRRRRRVRTGASGTAPRALAGAEQEGCAVASRSRSARTSDVLPMPLAGHEDELAAPSRRRLHDRLQRRQILRRVPAADPRRGHPRRGAARCTPAPGSDDGHRVDPGRCGPPAADRAIGQAHAAARDGVPRPADVGQPVQGDRPGPPSNSSGRRRAGARGQGEGRSRPPPGEPHVLLDEERPVGVGVDARRPSRS